VAKGYVRKWRVVPGARRGGRARFYYELTAQGIRAADAQRRILSELLGTAPSPASAEELREMRENIRRGSDLHAFGHVLRRGLTAALRRR
jgi:hypothetical protein